MNQYKELKDKQQERFNAFPMRFAFNDDQYREAMAWLGLDPADREKITGIGGGGFIRKADIPAYKELCDSADGEMSAAFAADPDGSGFIQAAFLYELGNHEYTVTGDLRDTLDALGFTAEQVRTDPRLTAGLKLALQRYSAQ